MSENAKPEDEMQAIEELLPWYAAGTVDAASVRLVEQALAREPKLQASLRLVQEDRTRRSSSTRVSARRARKPGRASWRRRRPSRAGRR
jgi:hypothetical protein